MLVDIHTHSPSDVEGVLSVHVLDVASDVGPSPKWRAFCAGLHPWNAQTGSFLAEQEAFERLQNWVALPQCLMVGETGLDKVKGGTGPAWELQREWAIRHFKLAKTIGRPVVVHCVRAYADILLCAKEAGYSGPVLFHDYNAGPEITKELLKNGDCYFSYGRALYRTGSKGLASLPLIPDERLFLETDDSGRSMHEVDEHFSKLRRIDSAENFKRLFGAHVTP